MVIYIRDFRGGSYLSAWLKNYLRRTVKGCKNSIVKFDYSYERLSFCLTVTVLVQVFHRREIEVSLNEDPGKMLNEDKADIKKLAKDLYAYYEIGDM